MKLADLATGLARLDLDAVAATALAAQANTIGEAVREALSHPPGLEHVYPWKQSGALQASIGVAAEGSEAVIGSTDPVASWQEHGTSRIPPRPFLAPVAAAQAEATAAAIGGAVAAAIGGV
jgi:hypothetical protein